MLLMVSRYWRYLLPLFTFPPLLPGGALVIWWHCQLEIVQILDTILVIISRVTYNISVSLICHGRYPMRLLVVPNRITKSGSGKPLVAVKTRKIIISEMMWLHHFLSYFLRHNLCPWRTTELSFRKCMWIIYFTSRMKSTNMEKN